MRDALRSALPERLLVAGELANVSRPSSGHLYFTLKDAESELRCVMWRSDAASMRFRPEDGLAVLATGAIDVYEPRGQYQFYVRRLEPRGVGALELAFRQLKERLAREGLFDVARKRPLPAFPRRIAVVTSPTGAAIRDILQTIRRRYPAVHVLVHPVRVQGDGAAAEIASAIAAINAQAERLGGIDVMIVGRGGGSLEDLWAFNEEIVARAIYASRIPIVSAVGHEVDFTIADFVADVRAATPTAAAELVVPLLSDLLAGLDDRRARLARTVRSLLALATSRLATAARNEWFRDPRGCILRREQQVDEAGSRLRLVTMRRISRQRDVLHCLERAMSRLRPEVVVAHRRERLARIEHRLRWAQGRANLLAERRLSALRTRWGVAGPQRIVDRDRLIIANSASRLRAAAAAMLARGSECVGQLRARLVAGSHERVLRRGFSITRRERGGRLVRGPRDVRIDERIVTQTAEGEIRSRVVDAAQGDLFEAD
ncbi:MAG: exodeoxyribonuclease VII large subunit [Phycisphaerae bacterium]|nr:exodeoxyribonuclease VII large subunit [Phycisphaerae bacterium]